MPRLVFVLTTVAALSPAVAQAQQPPKSTASDELRQTCREAAHRICTPAQQPSRNAYRRCVLDNRDKLPAPCAALIPGAGQAR